MPSSASWWLLFRETLVRSTSRTGLFLARLISTVALLFGPLYVEASARSAARYEIATLLSNGSGVLAVRADPDGILSSKNCEELTKIVGVSEVGWYTERGLVVFDRAPLTRIKLIEANPAMLRFLGGSSDGEYRADLYAGSAVIEEFGFRREELLSRVLMDMAWLEISGLSGFADRALVAPVLQTEAVSECWIDRSHLSVSGLAATVRSMLPSKSVGSIGTVGPETSSLLAAYSTRSSRVFLLAAGVLGVVLSWTFDFGFRQSFALYKMVGFSRCQLGIMGLLEMLILCALSATPALLLLGLFVELPAEDLDIVTYQGFVVVSILLAGSMISPIRIWAGDIHDQIKE